MKLSRILFFFCVNCKSFVSLFAQIIQSFFCFLHFAKLFIYFFNYRSQFVPVKAFFRSFFLKLVGAEQWRKSFRNFIKN